MFAYGTGVLKMPRDFLLLGVMAAPASHVPVPAVSCNTGFLGGWVPPGSFRTAAAHGGDLIWVDRLRAEKLGADCGRALQGILELDIERAGLCHAEESLRIAGHVLL